MKDIERTVQYWRLIDEKTQKKVPDLRWDQELPIIQNLDKQARTKSIDNEDVTGTIHTIRANNIPNILTNKLQIPSTFQNPHYERPISFSTPKDFVPSQQNDSDGQQKPVGIDSNHIPIDNLFVWHLPFGNMIATLAESPSSARAKKYANWLTKIMSSNGRFKNPNSSWDVEPVTDDQARQRVLSATKLRGFTVATARGSAANENTGIMQAVFSGPKRNFDGIRIELKVSLDRQRHSPQDEIALGDWFSSAFGSLDGEILKAKAVLPGSSTSPVTEVDLIKQRLTRKRRIPLAQTTHGSFSINSATDAILNAFEIDAQELYRLK